jgi:predicted nucleic acid-binding protein
MSRTRSASRSPPCARQPATCSGEYGSRRTARGSRRFGDCPRCEFWPDAISYRHADLNHVVGHRQVADAYLAALAVSKDGLLATFDAALAKALPDRVTLIP